MIGVSSCLAGCKCTYSGDDKLIKLVKEMVMRNEAIMICPEVLGGLSIPRSPCEIRDGKVVDINGVDWTKEYRLGAQKSLEILQEHDVDVVLLYDGTFSHTIINGDGITCQLLEKHGIIVFNDDNIDEFLKYIERR